MMTQATINNATPANANVIRPRGSTAFGSPVALAAGGLMKFARS